MLQQVINVFIGAQRRCASTHDFRQGLRRPRGFGQRLSPSRVERQQSLANRFVERAGLRAVVEDVELRILDFRLVRFAFDLNFSYERGDGLDEIRNGEQSYGRKARIRQPRVNALADGPTTRRMSAWR